MAILEFKDEYTFLSNFHRCNFYWDDMKWPHSEAAFQAAKTLSRDARRRFTTMTPAKSKMEGRKLVIRPDWDEVRVSVMTEIVRCKFEQNPTLRRALLATGDEHLEEGNYWKDTFWGVSPAGSGKGENNLGKILMLIRDELRASA